MKRDASSLKGLQRSPQRRCTRYGAERMARNDVVRYEDDTPTTNVGGTTTRTVSHSAVPPLLNFSKFWERYGEPPTKWLPGAFRDISELVCMSAGWDSYSAPSPRRDA